MSADDLKVATFKRGELPDWLKSEAEFQPKDQKTMLSWKKIPRLPF